MREFGSMLARCVSHLAADVILVSRKWPIMILVVLSGPRLGVCMEVAHPCNHPDWEDHIVIASV